MYGASSWLGCALQSRVATLVRDRVEMCVCMHGCVRACLCMRVHACAPAGVSAPPRPAAGERAAPAPRAEGVPAVAAPQVPLPRGLFAVNIHVFLSPGRLFSQ